MHEYHNSTINPFVNAGAIATTSLVTGRNSFENWSKLLTNMNKFAGKNLEVNDDMYMSELKTNNTNKTLAALLKSHDRIYANVEDTLDVYTRQGSVMINSTELAVMGSTLANCGRNPFTNEQIITNEHASFILACMMSNGLYNYSGPWICNVGLPGKSGVGGGVLAVVPGELAIGIISPKLDEFGNSVRGVKASIELSNLLNLNVFKTPSVCVKQKIILKKTKKKLQKKIKTRKLRVKSRQVGYNIAQELYKKPIHKKEKIVKIK